jgi:glucosamine 6-phosphate synthetase-like amidotransferase/phosphosugar isomerase protein
MAIKTKGLLLSDWAALNDSQKDSAVSSFLQRVQEPTLEQLEEQYQSVCEEINDITSSINSELGCSLHKGMHGNIILEELMEVRDCIHEKIQARSKSLTSLY